MEFIVCKFGGTSVATKENLLQISKILDLKPTRRCVVLSAPGKAGAITVKITDLLIKATQKALKNDDISDELSQIKKRYMDIYEPLGIEKNRIAHICNDFDKRFSSRRTMLENIVISSSRPGKTLMRGYSQNIWY